MAFILLEQPVAYLGEKKDLQRKIQKFVMRTEKQEKNNDFHTPRRNEYPKTKHQQHNQTT